MKKRKDGRYEKMLSLDGQRIHIYGRTREEIKAKEEEVRAQYYAGFLNIDTNISFGEYAEHWMEVRLPSLSLNTQDGYARAVRHLCSHLGRKYLVDIKRSEVEKALNEHRDTPTQRNRMRSVGSMIYKMAIDDGLLYVNPFDNIEKLKTWRKDRRVFTERETHAILTADLEPTERLIIDILYHTGIRKGELLGLSPKSVCKGHLHIFEQSLTDGTGAAEITPILKTESAYRDIPIPEWLEAEIRAYMREYPAVHIFDTARSKNTFYNRWYHCMIGISKVLYPNYIPKSLHNARAEDFPFYCGPHDFRHNYCSILHEKGVDVHIAKQIMGHNSIQTTLAIYTHLSEKATEKELQKVASIFEEKSETNLTKKLLKKAF